ncbi:DNA repair exonuclease SbcCD nuclease subunit [Paenibacillus castaneae]|uniref:metallophosphoesterase family protein n=1 Tax=Paenibacillus castaneae TaxID=474957 RepID=UPI000C9B4DB1|nr:DNA repair exonuclease [Paenibacillus castaneae]NIK75272.1 DNA repair exonuclease SbcCD nuclease subunit [Paenibacillus castaneae]
MSVPFRFIHAADLHLDSPFRGLAKAPEGVRDALTNSTFAALRHLTETAIHEKVDFIVLAGDLFDEADRSLRAQLMLVREWEKLEQHGIAVFVIHGNHDPLNGARAALKLPSNVYVFGADQMEYRPAYRRSGELAAFVYGISYGTRIMTDNVAASYAIQPEAPFHIALLHGNVDGDAAHDPYAPCTLDELTSGKGFDYWALGHIHHRRVLHQYPHVVYSGNTQGRNPRETEAKGCYIVDVTAARAVELTFAPLDEVRWFEHSFPIDAAGTEQELLQQLDSLVEQQLADADGRSVMLRLYLSGRGALHQKLAEPTVVRTLLEQLQESRPIRSDEPWVYVYGLEANTGALINWEQLESEDSFAGELHRYSQLLSDDGKLWREFAKEAISPISSHTKLGRLMRDRWEEPPARWLEQAHELTLGFISGNEREG